MNKRTFYFNLSNGVLVQVSCFRFYLRKWFHFPIKGYSLISISHYPYCNPDDLVLSWIAVLSDPKF